MPKLSVVTPIHNERENIPEFYKELSAALSSLEEEIGDHSLH